MNAKRMLQHSLASLMFAVVGCQQKLPNDGILKSFKEKFAEAKYATWKHMEGSIWEAAFLWNDKERTALFEENGEWLKTCTYLPLGTVPRVVKESYRKANTSNGLAKIFQVDTPKGIFYEFQMNESHAAFKIRYDAQGKIVENSIL